MDAKQCRETEALAQGSGGGSSGNGESCANSPLIGQWATTPDRAEFRTTCEFHSPTCQMSGDYDNNAVLRGKFWIRVKEVTPNTANGETDASCRDRIGDYDCTYALTKGAQKFGDKLVLGCVQRRPTDPRQIGDGTSSYPRSN